MNDDEYPYNSELKEPLKKPADIIETVERSKWTGGQSESHNLLKDRNINLSK